jgi:hypothetical protein
MAAAMAKPDTTYRYQITISIPSSASANEQRKLAEHVADAGFEALSKLAGTLGGTVTDTFVRSNARKPTASLPVKPIPTSIDGAAP